MKRQDNFRQRLLKDAAGSCIYCGHPLTMDTMEVDHIVPRSKGGTGEYDNLACVCSRCNAAKADRSSREFVDSMPLRKQLSFENRLTELYMQGKLSSAKWELLDPVPERPQSDRMSVCAPWQIFCYICGEFY